ncbi:MAG: 30S ribosome-binding factor RbfA [Bacteroidota bacterium]
MSESIVQKKLSKQIHQFLGDILTHELTFFSGILLTVSVVRVTKDLSLAKVYISAMPEAEADRVVDTLNQETWQIRKALARRLKNRLRKMPELRFYRDDSFEQAEKIERLLEEVEIPDADKATEVDGE